MTLARNHSIDEHASPDLTSLGQKWVVHAVKRAAVAPPSMHAQVLYSIAEVGAMPFTVPPFDHLGELERTTRKLPNPVHGALPVLKLQAVGAPPAGKESAKYH